MSAPNSSSRARLLAASTLTIAAVVMLPTGAAFAADAAPTAPASEASVGAFAVPADTATATAALAATPWQTTSAVDQNGNPVALSDPRAANFVGNAYFKADGTYTMFNLDDSPKLKGDWEMQIVDGQLVRWINAKNDAGTVLFQRTVPIVDLDANVFTYRVIDAADPSQWVDIVHTPTTHAEPGTIPGNGGGEGDVDGNADNENNTGNGNQNGTGDHQAGDSDGTKLPNTGGNSPLAGIISAVTAALGGLALLIRSALRRRLG